MYGPVRDKHVLLDSRVIGSAENARLALGSVVKDPHSPLFVEDKPWEVRFDNLYANVLFDQDERRYKCWYNPFIICEATSNTPRAERASLPYRPGKREMGLCYATSKDGIAWEKPKLGIFDFDGSRKNNLVMRNIHGVGVCVDPHDPDPSRRYKAFMTEGAATSPDGVHWSLFACPEIRAVGDTHNNVFWDERSGMYIGITRLWDRGQRTVGRTESADFRRWTKAEEVLRALPEQLHRQTYALLVFPYAGAYLGLLMLLNTEDDTVDAELAFSADTIRWERVCPGTPLIPRGPKGSFDWGCIYAAAYPISAEREILLYYGGSDDTHGSWRKGAFGLARLRPDGFAGMEPERPDETATIVTNPVACTGRSLRLTADATGGEIRVQVMDAPGLTLERCRPLTGAATGALVSWQGGSDLSALVEKDIRLCFALKSARLYAFGFAD